MTYPCYCIQCPIPVDNGNTNLRDEVRAMLEEAWVYQTCSVAYTQQSIKLTRAQATKCSLYPSRKHWTQLARICPRKGCLQLSWRTNQPQQNPTKLTCFFPLYVKLADLKTHLSVKGSHSGLKWPQLQQPQGSRTLSSRKWGGGQVQPFGVYSNIT